MGWFGFSGVVELAGFRFGVKKERKLVRVGEKESKEEKGVWANRVKNGSNMSVRGKIIWDNRPIARVNNEEEQEKEGRVKYIKQGKPGRGKGRWDLGFRIWEGEK